MVRVEQRGPVRWITISREARRNALNARVVAEIGRAIETAESVEGCLAIVLTGAGTRAFCAGADLEPGAQGFAFAVDHSRPTHYLVDLFKLMRGCRLPIIARVNGHVMAGGVGLLCACDMAVAAEHAMIGTPETKIGLVPMMILPGMLRVIPERKLLEMCLTGEPIGAPEALALGIVNHLAPQEELDAKLEWLLARLLDKSPTAIRIGKQAFHAMRDMSVEQGLEYAQVMVTAMASTRDAQEGIRAFGEKRPPAWTGS
ncbi:enoyl-CoA hydratase/isomerase family protein [Verticiella sediminum]|uniref:Enoyl-CoA hydratase/isomerase family protein n=1 Tax=Verticiella sediminum TaxID=1247510 RepID=A0A556B147_9BURK|nr:enoyl-CoA hydratase/isomerase family protein [Verticiella sediminum]